MAGSYARRLPFSCPNCGGRVVEVGFKGNQGEVMSLEVHCNTCKWAVDDEGYVRHQNYRRDLRKLDSPFPPFPSKER